MSEPYQAYLLMPNGITPDTAVQTSHEIMTRLGGVMDEDSLVILNEIGEEDAKVFYSENVYETLEKLTAWPTMGSVSYDYHDVMTTLSFYSLEKAAVAIGVSALERSFEQKPGYREACIDLVKTLDEVLHPTRTIMQWGLERSGFSWQEEINRLRSGEFQGRYEILDIRRRGDTSQAPVE